MALGAERAAVVAMVMRGVALQAALGLAIGVPVAVLCVRFVRAQLYDVTRMNISVLASAILPLAIAACLAGWVPARRAASTDPAQSLRTE
jgi:ABC-type antimicrobial peptide transport system permease subunit